MVRAADSRKRNVARLLQDAADKASRGVRAKRQVQQHLSGRRQWRWR